MTAWEDSMLNLWPPTSNRNRSEETTTTYSHARVGKTCRAINLRPWISEWIGSSWWSMILSSSVWSKKCSSLWLSTVSTAASSWCLLATLCPRRRNWRNHGSKVHDQKSSPSTISPSRISRLLQSIDRRLTPCRVVLTSFLEPIHLVDSLPISLSFAFQSFSFLLASPVICFRESSFCRTSYIIT